MKKSAIFFLFAIFFISTHCAYAVTLQGEVAGTNLIIKGETFPNSIVHLNKGKDSQDISTTNSDSNGDFTFTLNDIASGSSEYITYALDKKGTKTSNTIDIDVTPHADNSVNSLLPPTIYSNGNAISGFAHPGDTIQVLFNTTQKEQTTVNPNGEWTYAVNNNTNLTNGTTYQISAVDVSNNGQTSESSSTITFAYQEGGETQAQIKNQSSDLFTPIINNLRKSTNVIVYAIQQNKVATEATGVASAIVYTIPQSTNILNAFYEVLISISEMPIELFRLLVLFLEFIGIKQKPPAWGVVFDSLSKQPVDPVVVKLTPINSSNQKEETRITDFEGRFGFLVDPGKYVITINKAGYRFPSEILKGKTVDEDRENIYFGGEIEVNKENVINVNIPIDPLEFNWNQAAKPIQYKLDRSKLVIRRLSLSLLVAGFIASVYYIVKDFNLTNLILLLLYPVFFYISQFIVKRQKPWGVVINKSSGNVYPLVTIKALKGEFKVVGGSCITDHLGRYYLILSEGKYILQAETNSEEGKKVLWQSPEFNITKNNSVVNWNINI